MVDVLALESLAFDLASVWGVFSGETVVLELLEFGWPIASWFMHVCLSINIYN